MSDPNVLPGLGVLAGLGVGTVLWLGFWLLVFLAIRWLVLWYWKINRAVASLELMARSLDRVAGSLQHLETRPAPAGPAPAAPSAAPRPAAPAAPPAPATAGAPYRLVVTG
jgi:hypothetical protein